MNRLLIITTLFVSLMNFSQELPVDTSELCPLLAQMKTDDQLYREELSKLIREGGSKTTIDSLWILQKKLDNKNTEQLITLTLTYGWLSNERLGCDFKPLVFLIFRHSQDQYFEEIAPLINTALEAERLSQFHYNFINDHLKGRPKG